MTTVATRTTEESSFIDPRSSTINQREQMKIVIVGHVDHGKSTLIGRLFHDTGSLPDGKFEQIKATSEKRGMPFEWAFLLDALQAERDQGITIDTTQIWFKTEARDYVIIDAPGHKEFLKNMISGAASSEAAVLVIDAHEGVQEQSKRHGYLLHLLGVRQIAVAVNKMDLVNYSEDHFKKIEKEYRAYLDSIGVEPTYIIPVSAREGDNIASTTDTMPWYTGPSIVEALDHFEPYVPLTEQPLRFPIQDVYKFDERRIVAGRIESGRLKVGDTLLFSPRNRTAKVKTIEWWTEGDQPAPTEAHAGQSIGVTLDEQLFIERGHLASHTEDAPKLTNIFKARLVWLGDDPLLPNKRYKLKLGTAEHTAEIAEITDIISTGDLSHSKAAQIERNEVAEVIIRTKGQLSLDDFTDNARTGRFVLVDNYRVVGGGIISTEDYADQRVAVRETKSTHISREESPIDFTQRAIANGHTGGILWFTGLSGSGKSTLAKELEKRLFQKGYQVYVLDGDNIRRGLNADLGFAPEDRAENIRRVGEVASLFADSGHIVISAFISPYRNDRQMARNASQELFHEVHIKADVDTCEKRDVKGLYAKARSGEISEFTGISAPYEAPKNPELAVDTEVLSIEAAVDQLEDYVERYFVDPVRKGELGKAEFEI